MNEHIATVVDIQNNESLNIVEFEISNQSLFMMSLELGKVKIDSKVKLAVKSTSVAIAKNFSGQISFSNQLKAKITDISKGKLLSNIKTLSNDISLESILTTQNVDAMDLHVGDEVTVFIRASELSIKEVLV
ncbi:TOBE domain-containing protein [Sulfurospirillum arcachonense]|uniref:TOBE domain-containing protein n=1 Tax=Sulfurospirillum arcachonense TaxID=57666 RepID=UPI00046A9CF9|nr:TOBE domain-containing protein [Sulfurospirillum arcachonense]